MTSSINLARILYLENESRSNIELGQFIEHQTTKVFIEKIGRKCALKIQSQTPF